MIISTVKHFDTCIISKRKLAKTKFGKSLSAIADIEELKNKIVDVLEHNGRGDRNIELYSERGKRKCHCIIT